MTNTEYQQLVQFLTGQFTALDQRFMALERRVEEGFREASGHFDAIYRRFERLEQEYHAIVEALRRIESIRLPRIETILTDEHGRREILEQGLAELKERVALLQARIDELERRLQS